MSHRKTTLLLTIGIHLLLYSCNSKDEKKPLDATKDTGSVNKEIKPVPKPAIVSKKPPIINIVDTVAPKRIVVCIKDSASTSERISMKLGQIYGIKLAELFKKNNLKITGQPMAWYTTQKAPYFFEAGIPVNRAPTRSVRGIRIREIRADSAVVAHFYGPYDLLYMGYDALKDYMKEHHKKTAGAPYEIYVTDPLDKKGKPVDPYKIQTDIIFPLK